MNASAKINKKEIICISIVWTILSLISSLDYIDNGFIIALIAFMLPLALYIGIAYKFGSGYILEKISQNDVTKILFDFMNRALKIININTDVINGSATKKTRIMILSVVSLLILSALLSSIRLDVKLAVLILYLPLLYPLFKGYRLAIIALLSIKLIDTVNVFISGGSIAINTFTLIILGSIYVYALYVENLRMNFIKTGKIPAPKDMAKKDTSITIGLYIMCFILATIAILQIIA